jgi:hypothetical protein
VTGIEGKDFENTGRTLDEVPQAWRGDAFHILHGRRGDLPCPRIVACWQAFFPVEMYLRKMLSSRRWEAFTERKPREKLASLLESVEEAKRKDNEE